MGRRTTTCTDPTRRLAYRHSLAAFLPSHASRREMANGLKACCTGMIWRRFTFRGQGGPRPGEKRGPARPRATICGARSLPTTRSTSAAAAGGWPIVSTGMLGSVHEALLSEDPPDRPPAYAERHMEIIRTTVMPDGDRGSGFVPWRLRAMQVSQVRRTSATRPVGRPHHGRRSRWPRQQSHRDARAPHSIPDGPSHRTRYR